MTMLHGCGTARVESPSRQRIQAAAAQSELFMVATELHRFPLVE